MRITWKSTAESLLSEMTLSIDKIAMYKERSYLGSARALALGSGVVDVSSPLVP